MISYLGSCGEVPFDLPPSVPDFFYDLMYDGLSPLEMYGFTMGAVHGVSQKCFEGLAEFDFFGVENRFNDASATTGTPLVEFTYEGPPGPMDASENGERKLYGYYRPFPIIHEGIEMFEEMGEEICKDAGGEYVTLDGTVTMDAESSYWFRTFAPAAHLLKAPGLSRYGYFDPYSIKYWFEMYSYEYEHWCDITIPPPPPEVPPVVPPLPPLPPVPTDENDSGDRKLYGYGPSFPLDMCIPYVEFRNRYACVPKKNACTDEEIATIITTSTVTMDEIPMIGPGYGYGPGYGTTTEPESTEGEPSDDPERKMAANKKASKYQPKQQQKQNPENDVSSAGSKRKLEGHDWPEPVSLFSKCTDVPTVTKVGKSAKAAKAAKASKSPKLRNRM